MSLEPEDKTSQSDSGSLATSGSILSTLDGECFSLAFFGDVRLVWSVTLERYCESIFEQAKISRFYVDVSTAENLDSTTLGVLAKLALLCKNKLNFFAELYFDHPDIERLVVSMGFKSVFEFVTKDNVLKLDYLSMQTLGGASWTEDEVRRSVLAAHKTLAGLSMENNEKFKALIDSLDKD